MSQLYLKCALCIVENSMKRIIVVCMISLFALQNVKGTEKVSNKHDKKRTEIAIEADVEFYTLLHGKNTVKNYNSVVKQLTKATIKDPQDVYSIAHLGFTKIWAVVEGLDKGIIQPIDVVQTLQDSEQAFLRANTMAPDEPRILGFLGFSRLLLGRFTNNNALIAKAQADIDRSVRLWPEWAHFGSAYVFDTAPYDSKAFAQVLNKYWSVIDVCSNTTFDRQNPDLMLYMSQQTLTGRDRACWDSWITPHNMEGFFLIMGDAMVKAGNTDLAFILYNNSKLLKHYNSWPFRGLLERRISNIERNVENFRKSKIGIQSPDPETSLISITNISCSICHSGNANSQYEIPVWVGESANEFLVIPSK